MKINIANANKAEVLAALYNGSFQLGMVVMHSRGREPMTTEQAQAELDANPNGYFDYLHGRVMKVRLGGDEFDTWLYDRDNGQGAAWRILESVEGCMLVPEEETADA